MWNTSKVSSLREIESSLIYYKFFKQFFFHLFFFFFYYQQKLIDYFRIIYKKYLVILKSSIFLRWINTFFNKINCALFSKIISWNYEKILRNWTVLFSSWERKRKLFIRSILQIIKKQRIVQIISSNLFSFKRNKSLQKYQSWKSQGNKTTTIQPHSLPIIPKKKKRKNSNENTSQEKLKILKKMKQLPLTHELNEQQLILLKKKKKKNPMQRNVSGWKGGKNYRIPRWKWGYSRSSAKAGPMIEAAMRASPIRDDILRESARGGHVYQRCIVGRNGNWQRRYRKCVRWPAHHGIYELTPLSPSEQSRPTRRDGKIYHGRMPPFNSVRAVPACTRFCIAMQFAITRGVRSGLGLNGGNFQETHRTFWGRGLRERVQIHGIAFLYLYEDNFWIF